MPIYEYRCKKGHTFEVMQRMTDDPVTSCERCGATTQRVFHPIAVHFKGSGFYNTDYGKKKGGGGTDKEPSGDSSSTSSDSGKSSDKSSSSKSSDAKPSSGSKSSAKSSSD